MNEQVPIFPVDWPHHEYIYTQKTSSELPWMKETLLLDDFYRIYNNSQLPYLLAFIWLIHEKVMDILYGDGGQQSVVVICWSQESDLHT